LAERWESDPAGRRYTFHLRPHTAFHDGRPIAAGEVRASLLRALAPETQAARQWPLLPILGAADYAAGRSREVRGIDVRDDSTIAFTLAEPLNLFPLFLAMPVAAVVPVPAPPGFDQHPVGSGPWRFVSWSHDDAILLARNDRWWGGAPLEDSLRIRIIPEALTQSAEYEAGLLSVL
jgi:ABC-type transport system substrate-binding protein